MTSQTGILTEDNRAHKPPSGRPISGRESLPAGSPCSAAPTHRLLLFCRGHLLAIGIGSLALFWCWKLYSTWGAWGNLTIDSGREMYVPKLLAQGKMLYRDVRYIYGPAAPYFNSWLFRIFGIHLEVLYWAGSLAALISAVLLFLSGRALRPAAASTPATGFQLAGWTAGAVLLAESFHPSLFCFPLAYSFASVYGCLASCLFLWCALRAWQSPGWSWLCGAGLAAGAALVTKLEFGAACYGTLALLLAGRAWAHPSWPKAARDALALLPGALLCLLAVRWMVSIAGADFITQRNIESWPGSYFMKTYGRFWLQQNGLTLTWPDFRDALMRSAPLIGLIIVLESRLWRNAFLQAQWLRAVLALGTVADLVSVALQAPEKRYFQAALSALFFPQDMVLYIAFAAALWTALLLLRRGLLSQQFPAAMTCSFTALLGFRMLMRMRPSDYAIYYNGPAVLCFLLLGCLFLSRIRSRRAAAWAQASLCAGCLLAALAVASDLEAGAAGFVPYQTPYGTVRVAPALAKTYPAAVQFIKEKAARGEAVMSLPEDTTLYFLSDTVAPTWVYVFTPGALPPGQPTLELIEQIERHNVKYLLWSNRTFVEYGVPFFGRDFNADLGNYLHQHYRRIGPLIPPASFWDWTVVVWERNAP